MTTRAEIQEYWSSIKPAIRERWTNLGDEELQAANGSAGHLVGLIQQRTGASREDIERYLESLVAQAQGGLRQAKARIAGRPISSTAIALGAGFVAGVVLVEALAPSRRRTPEDLATKLGRRMLDSLHEIVPDSVRQYLPS
jgi:uncharacterized protein YjbJ (UPF0337 family)